MTSDESLLLPPPHPGRKASASAPAPVPIAHYREGRRSPGWQSAVSPPDLTAHGPCAGVFRTRSFCRARALPACLARAPVVRLCLLSRGMCSSHPPKPKETAIRIVAKKCRALDESLDEDDLPQANRLCRHAGRKLLSAFPHRSIGYLSHEELNLHPVLLGANALKQNDAFQHCGRRKT